jgi:superfamily II DNA or RNA helicase
MIMGCIHRYFGDNEYHINNSTNYINMVYQYILRHNRVKYLLNEITREALAKYTYVEERNRMILDVILKHQDRHFLVLCKRISQARYLIEDLEKNGENVTSLLGNNNKFDEKSRILVATVQKCGVGFSHDVLDALVIASDMEEYFIQYLGRVMRTEEVEPIIFDFVDEHPILQRHFQTRKKVYQESGGIIKTIKKD